MTLKKDDKTSVKKENLNTKVVQKAQKAQKQEKQKGAVSANIEKGIENGLTSEKPKETRCNGVKENGYVESVLNGSFGPSIDGPGPSGKVLSPDERERNLQELFRQQRNFLRRLLADTDDEDEAELLPYEEDQEEQEEDQDQEEQEVD